MSKADELRQQANEADRRAEESFERSDTDGFLSQWASGITARQLRAQAEIEENGGVAEFPGLFEQETGRRIKAKLVLVDDRFRGYGKKQIWLVLDEDDQAVHWINRTTTPMGDFPSARSKMGQLGLFEDWELGEARAEIFASGTGLSGAASAQVIKRRTDQGYPNGAKVIS